MHEVASFVREVMLEWAALRVRILVPVGRDFSNAVQLVKHYRPQLLLVVTRRPAPDLARRIRREVRRMGLRPPAVEVVLLKGGTIEEIVRELRRPTSRVDVVGVDSDDGALSAAVTLAAALQGKRLALLRDGRVEEHGVEKLLSREGE